MVMQEQLQDKDKQRQLFRLKTSARRLLLCSSLYVRFSCLVMPGLAFLPPTSPSTRPPKRVRQEQGQQSGNQRDLQQQVQELRGQMQKMCTLVRAHDQAIRDMEAWCTRTWIMDGQGELAAELQGQMDQWREQLPPHGQPHPQGPARHTIAAALAKWLLQDPARREAMPNFAKLHDAMTKIQDLQASVNLAYVKTVKDGRLLLKLRPQITAQAEWSEVFQWIDASLDNLKAESRDVAPKGSLVRALSRKSEVGE